MKQFNKINITTQTQVGASEYWQFPSSRTLEMLGYSGGDHYYQYQVTMNRDQVDDFVEEAKETGTIEKKMMVQLTSTTMAGGMQQIDVRVQDLIYNGDQESSEEEEQGKSEEELTEEEKQDEEEMKSNAKVMSCDIGFQECPICTHPDLAEYAEKDEAKANVMGMVAKGANIYKPVVVNDKGDMKVPVKFLSPGLASLISRIPTFQVKVINITYSYKTRVNPRKRSSKPQVGDDIDVQKLPGNGMGSKFGTNGSATYLGQSYTYEDGMFTVEDRYIIEIVPTLEEVKNKVRNKQM